MFASPEQFGDATHIADSAEQYRLLKEEEHSCWEEWERLSLEAESIDDQISTLEDLAAAAQT